MRKGFFVFTLILSILLGAVTFVGHRWYFEEGQVDIKLPENWREMSDQEKLNSLDRLLLTNATFPLVSKIEQRTIRRQFKKMVMGKQDKVLRDGFGYSFVFRFHKGWKESGLLGLVGFASVWIIYAVVSVVSLLIPSAPMIHFPSRPLRGQIEFLHFPVWREPVRLSSVRITLFGFLALEEQPKRPKKPAAVWID